MEVCLLHMLHLQRTNPLIMCDLMKVIDEADRMMEDIKQDWLHEVEKAVFDSPNRPKPSTITAAK